ncbi:MAG: hypothetical protein ACK4FF_08730 [Limnobacter sp.]|uniref:hypothetical protein n=1 Tax=Limnobacter sp. TaxID=2003368 RepID=UPI003919E407
MKTPTILTALITATLASPVFAQATFEGNVNAYETPLGRTSVVDIDSAVSGRRDSRFNRVNVESPGFGFASTAIGNLISVDTQGSNNTITIYATQINNGSQRATIGGLD